RSRYFAVGIVSVDTGGEFLSAADRPESGQDRDRREGISGASDVLAEFATSVNNDTGGEFVLTLENRPKCLHQAPYLTQLPAYDLPTGIRQQYHCWVYPIIAGPPCLCIRAAGCR